MTAMNITLPDGLRKFVEAQVAEEGYASADEHLQAVLEEARKRKAMQNLVAKLDEALADGPAEPMTREDWDALERNVRERERRSNPEGMPRS